MAQRPCGHPPKVKCVDVLAHGEIPAILDGEKVKIERRAKVTFPPTAFRAIVPAADGGE